jgi:putative inorganic carbon (HCO3(-)) transporter
MSSATNLPRLRYPPGSTMAAIAARPLQALVAAPALLFLAAMTAMLFRPPDVKFFALDRLLFVLLLFVMGLRVCALQLPLRLPAPVALPMFGLLLLSLMDVVGQPFEPQNWSVFAAKWVVPLTFYLLAPYIFESKMALRHFETFALLALGYLTFTALMSAAGVNALIFPRYILDETLGIHADRARGPFLQAVANGVTLNLLGLLAFNSFRRGRLRGPLGWILVAALPIAILATKTRAVWLSFAASSLVLLVMYLRKKICRARWLVMVVAILALVAIVALTNCSLHDRLQDRSPVEYRMAVYEAGWQMFSERPLFGWPAGSVQNELYKRISGFHADAFYLHDTYLEIAVQHGMLGLALYIWLIADLLRLGRKPRSSNRNCSFLDGDFPSLWRLMVFVYLVNASFVVMNYQFVNGFLFTIAGLLAANARRAQLVEDGNAS